MKPSIPKGTRDFLPAQAKKRNFIFQQLRSVFETYGYSPIETPAMERKETLLGKYGEEGDRLIFKVLQRGEKLQKAITASDVQENNLYEDALRYDLTVPFARFVVQYQNEIEFPFKRYQIQPVWRADRPQKGRYREFYQCDIDVIGTESLNAEVELIQMINDGFTRLGIPDVSIQLNNRKVLQGIAEKVKAPERFMDITIAIDKIDKIGFDGVQKELSDKGLSQEQIKALAPFLQLQGTNEGLLIFLENSLADVSAGIKGVEELRYALGKANAANVQLNFSLARGLNYYTGCIFEVTHPEFNSSICGGGRYDDLTGIFGLKNVSGVGVSFGADRIYDLMEEKNLFPTALQKGAEVLFINFGEASYNKSLELATELRKKGVRTEVYLQADKLKKQFKYADAQGFDFVIKIDEKALENEQANARDVSANEQIELPQSELINWILTKRNLRNKA